MTAADIAGWATFFGILAQIGATLAGLLFVGFTISLPHLIGVKGYLSRAFTVLALQFEILVIGIFGIVPDQAPWALGIELVFTGAFVLAGTQVFARNFPEDEKSDVLAGAAPRIVRLVLLALSTGFPMLAGAGLYIGWADALYLLIPAVIASVYLSIGYAWIFAVEIPRRNTEK